MTRKEILVFQLREVRNEFAHALADLTQEQLTARPLGDHNPVGWIACHCMHNFDCFLYWCQTQQTLMAADGEYGDLARYGWNDPTEDNPPPNLSRLADAVDDVFARCIEIIEGVDEEKLHEQAPHWDHEDFESTAGNCVRVINHGNAHMRQIWMLRGAMGDRGHWPIQRLHKKPNAERGRFYVPDG